VLAIEPGCQLVQQRTELLPFGKNIVRRSIRSGALSIKKEDFEGLAAEGRAKNDRPARPRRRGRARHRRQRQRPHRGGGAGASQTQSVDVVNALLCYAVERLRGRQLGRNQPAAESPRLSLAQSILGDNFDCDEIPRWRSSRQAQPRAPIFPNLPGLRPRRPRRGSHPER